MLDHQTGANMLIASPRATQGGVTLIEAMIAIAILAIVLVTGLPGLQNWIKNARIRTTAEEALAGLQLARSEAVRSNCTVDFTLDAGGGWTVTRGANCPDAGTVQSRPADEAVGEVVVTPTPGGATTVTFNGMGMRTANADASATLTSFVVDLPAAVLSAPETRQLQLEIELNGQIRMCDPEVVNPDDSRLCS